MSRRLTNMRRASRWRGAQGFTLPELIVSIVIISVALAGVLLVMTTTVQRSADPLIQQQAMAVAEAYLEEITARQFGTATGATQRQDYETTMDYDGLESVPPADQFDTPISGLASYEVTVNVGSGSIGGVSGGDVQLIDVQVTHPSGVNILLSGYKLNY